jgi:hypothetical protein
MQVLVVEQVVKIRELEEELEVIEILFLQKHLVEEVHLKQL